MLVNAYLDLTMQAKELKPYLPNSRIPRDNQVFKPIRNLGIEYWYEMFNPRQLLILLRLIKYISKRAAALIEDKGEYGVAVSAYLAFGVDKLLDYNNISTMWHTHRGVMNRLGDQYAAKKSVSLGLEYCEAKRIDLALKWVYEPDIDKPAATHGGISPVLERLCEWLYGMGDRVEVYMGDAREVSKIVRNADLVNVDPPYLNQHFYSDLSEFFWQALMLTLKPAIESGFLFNRDEKRGRVECRVSGWSPSLPTVPRSGEIIVRKGRGKLDVAEVRFTTEWWREQMWKFFRETYDMLKNDGILIVWYTHSDPQAWEAVLSGLYSSNFMISKVWNIRTEPGRFIARLGGSAFFTSLALVATKTVESIIVGERKPNHIKLCLGKS
jgi:putative DNA methylase